MGKLVAGVALIAGAGTSVAVASTAHTEPMDHGAVDRVVDGDTLDVRLSGRLTRIRLLNVDTPETVDPNRPVECLGPEATTFLRGLLPPGAAVSLEYDKERTDRYGRALAAVHTADGRLVNAETARQGLGAAIVIRVNDRFFAQVEQARTEAESAGRGLSSTDDACTVPAQTATVTAAAAGVPAVDPQASRGSSA